MKEYRIVINREKDDLTKFMKKKSEKIGLQCKFEEGRVRVEAKDGEDMRSQTPVPVMFQGKITAQGDETLIIGRFTYGFYFTTLVFVAAILIVARFLWSLFQKQTGNMILCGIVTGLLILVCVVVRVKGRALKTKILQFLQELEKR